MFRKHFFIHDLSKCGLGPLEKYRFKQWVCRLNILANASVASCLEDMHGVC